MTFKLSLCDTNITFWAKEIGFSLHFIISNKNLIKSQADDCLTTSGGKNLGDGRQDETEEDI